MTTITSKSTGETWTIVDLENMLFPCGAQMLIKATVAGFTYTPEKYATLVLAFHNPSGLRKANQEKYGEETEFFRVSLNPFVAAIMHRDGVCNGDLIVMTVVGMFPKGTYTGKDGVERESARLFTAPNLTRKDDESIPDFIARIRECFYILAHKKVKELAPEETTAPKAVKATPAVKAPKAVTKTTKVVAKVAVKATPVVEETHSWIDDDESFDGSEEFPF